MDQPTEKEVAETRKTDMERAKTAIEAGVASADDVAESFYGPGVTYNGDIRINWERRAAQAAIDAEQPDDMGDEDLAAMGHDVGDGEDGGEEELSDEKLDELAAADDEDVEWDLDDEDEDEPDNAARSDDWRTDKGAAAGARSGVHTAGGK